MVARFVVAGMLFVALVAIEPAAPATAETTTFPDGTELELTITEPDDGSPSIGGSVDLAGTARVGASDTEPDTSLVVVYDGSGSTLDPAGGDCGGDLNGDGRSNTILDCEIAAIGELTRTADELGTVSEVGVTLFEINGRATDVRPESGFQTLTHPGADLNDNGVLDVYEVVETTRWSSLFILSRSRVSRFTSVDAGGIGGGTNYSAGLSSACNTLAATSEPNRVIVFLSDGAANRGSVVDSVLPCAQTATVNTFAVGANSACDLNPTNLGSLQDIADLTGGTCTEVVEPSDLPDVLSGSIVPEVVRLELSVNGGPPIDISDAAAVPLPAPGPDPFDWSYTVEGLTGPVDELCVTAIAEAGSQTTSASDCVTVIDNQPPVADAGDDLVVVEGAVATLDGSGSSDPDGDPLSYAWSLASADGPPVLLTSTNDVVATFATLDDGIYELDLEVSDGRLTDTDRVTVTVANDEPVVQGLAEPAAEGGVALVTATFTDGGPLDAHEATIDWGDGSAAESVPISAQGTGWGSLFAGHVYDSGGSFTATVTVVDDDGGSGTDTSVSVEVRDSLALWANSTDADDVLDWTGGDGTATGLIHSNGGLRITGAGKHIVGGRTEYASSITVKGSTEIEPAPVQVTPSDYPIVFELADYRPGGRAAIDAGSAYVDASTECGSSGVWQPNGPLAPGLYYVDCDVHLVADALTGTVTIAAEGSIQLSGTDAVFDPYIDGLLAISGGAGDAAIDVSASNSQLLGFLFAADGGVDLAGSASEYLCGILADRIDISGSDIEIRASDCVRPRRTTAPPTLVPDLSLEVTNSADSILPGTAVTTAANVRNDGAQLLVAGIVGLENLGDESIAVTDATFAIETLAAGATAWTPLDEPVEIRLAANPADGVVHPGTDGGVAGTTIDPSGLATWAAELQAVLPPETVTRLLDPAQTDAIRVSADFELENPTHEPVRRLFRFGTDLARELRELGSELHDVTVTGAGIDGVADTRASTEEPGLASVAPGDDVVVAFDATVPVVNQRGAAEPPDAYLGRLHALDESVLTGMAFASATAGIGRILAPIDGDASMRVLPIVETALTGPSSAVAGTAVTYDVEASNRGSASADAIAASGTIDGADVPVEGLVDQLGPAGVDLGSFTTTVPIERSEGAMPASVDVAWTDANGNAYGPIDRVATTSIGTPPDLSALLSDQLLIDADDTGLPSPGDTLRYQLTVTNRGSTPSTGVAASLPPDPNGQLIESSVTGATVAATSPALELELGTIDGMSSAEVTFDVVIDDPVPDGVTSITLQGAVASDDTDPFPTDDPGEHGGADPTVTRLVDTPPKLQAALAERLVTDVDGNGFAGPGDQISYVALIENAGLSAASEVILDVPVHPATVPVDGSLTVDGADAVSGSDPGDTAVVVSADALAGLGSIFVEWTVDVVDPLPPDLTEISVQGTADAAEVDLAPTDDPNLPGTTDPTVTPVFVGGTGGGDSGGGGSGGGSVGNGLPAPTVGAISPSPEEALSAPTAVSTTLTAPDGETVVGWTVALRRPDGSEVELATGTGPDVSAVVDPTALANGAYEILIIGESSNGGISVTESQILVEGDYKPGRVQMTIEDLAFDVGPAAFRLLRSYDSFDTSVGDFGHGWSLDVADFTIRTNGPLGLGGWQQDVIGGGLIFATLGYSTTVPHYVTVTWPDGRNEIFDLTPSDGSTFLSGLTSAEFEGRPGTTSTLEAFDTSLWFGGDGNLYGGFLGTGGVYDPTRFRLTARDGTEYVLDTRLGLVSTRDPLGNTVTIDEGGISASTGEGVSFERDAAGRITRIASTDGDELTYGYDSNGDLVSVTDAAGVTTFTYAPGHLLDQVLGDGGTPLQILEYGPDGRLIAIIDGEGNRTEVSFDITAGTETRVDPEGRLTTIDTYDADGRLRRTDEVADGTTRTWTYDYDADGRPIRTETPTGDVTEVTYDGDGNVVEVVQPGGPTFGYDHDDAGRVIAEYVDDVLVREVEYSAAGQVVRDERLADGVVAYTYGSGGRLASSTENGVTTTYGYTDGKLTSVTEGSFVTQASYTGDLITQIVGPDGAVTNYEFDANDLLTAIIDDTGRRYEYQYDANGRLLAEIDPIHGAIEYGYDDAGRVASITDRNGVTSTIVYDRNGQVLQQSSAEDTATFAYDGFGRMISAADDDSLLTFTYDAGDQPVTQTQSGPGLPTVEIGWTYGPGGLVSSRTTPAGTIDVQRDVQRAISSISAPGMTGPITFDYDEVGRMTDRVLPNGVADELTYGSTGLLLERVATVGESSVLDWLATYGEGARRTTLTVDGVTTSYGYDLAGRLTAAGSSVFGYDTVGNRTSAPGIPAANYGADHRLLGDGTFTYGYDPTGNLTSRSETATGTSTTYTWDAHNRLAGIDRPDGSSVAYRRDAFGRVIEIDDGGTTTSFVHDGTNLVLEYDDGDQLAAWYVPDEATGAAHAVRREGEWYYLVVDGHGSVVAVTDASGAVVENLDYGTWGELLGDTPTLAPAYTYAGLRYDPASGWYDARARHYDASLGRFVSVDPIPSLNPYVYAANDPISLVDPLGEAAASEYSIIGSRATVQSVVVQELAALICGQLVNAAILGLGRGPNGMGSAGEQYVRDKLGIPNPDRTPYNINGRTRVPDLLTDNSIIEVKNTSRQSLTRQIRDLIEQVKRGGRGGVLVARTSTQLSGPLVQAAKRTPGFVILACLPG